MLLVPMWNNMFCQKLGPNLSNIFKLLNGNGLKWYFLKLGALYFMFGLQMETWLEIFVASEASDPTFKTIHFQYYTLVALIQINTSGTVRRRRRRRRRRSRFPGVETPPKPIHISKNRLCSMKAGSAKGAQFHLLVNICHSFFLWPFFCFFV